MENIIENPIKIENSKWIDYQYKITKSVISLNSLENSLNKFYSDVMLNLENDQKILIIFKVKIVNGPFRNISKLQKINKLEFFDLVDIFFEYWNIRSSEYNQYPIEEIVYTYWIIPDSLNTKNNENIINSQLSTNNNKNKSIKLKSGLLDAINFGGYNLPNTMDITMWGKCDFYKNYNEAIIYKNNSIGVYNVKLYDKYLLAELKIKNNTVLSFKDILLDNYNLSSFKREIDDQEYIFKEGKLITKSKTYKSKFIKPIVGDYYFINNIITMDLETRTINGKMEVYQISIFDGKEIKVFYLNDFNSSEEMLQMSLKSLMIRKYNGYKVYLHNFSNFDGVFLLRVISSLSNDIKIVVKDTKIINLNIKFGDLKYSITFRDSFLLLPTSLNKLAISFDEELKLIYPYAFLNDNNVSLDYKGKVPEFKFFNNLGILEYKEYCKQFKNIEWNLREETAKYCNQDVKILYNIIYKFNKKIYELFRINVIKYPTLSSLSFAIYRAMFLKDHKIPIISGELYNFIKKGYTGGAVDVYKPFGKFVYRYDINSLYPFIMKEFPMPVSNPTLLEGDISDLNLNEIAFVETEVIAPDNLNIPFLQTRIKSKNGDYRTVSPLGKWVGVYNNNEIKKGMELGYKFKFIRAVTFKKDYIFNEFVSYFYELKKNSDKNTSHYIIAKFILNSLSGRFALEPILDKHEIVDNIKTLELANNNIVNSVINLGNDKNLVSYKKNIKNIEDNGYASPNISIPISANITANARVWMSQFKKEGLLYSDTDSIDTCNILDAKYIGSELGQMKLEHFFHEAIYLAPKVYGGYTPKYEVVKVKGLKNPVKYEELLPLLYKNNKLEIYQEKWLKDIGKGHISIQNEIYTLMITDSKRQIIYNEDNKFIDTKPLKINNENIEKEK